MVLGKLDIYFQRNEIGPLSHTTYKSQDININSETVKGEENIGEKFLDSLGNNFLNMTPKAQGKKAKTDK